MVQGLTSVVIVENPLLKTLVSSNTGEFTLEKGLMSVTNVGNLLAKALHFFSIGEFTAEKGMSAVNVGKALLTALVSSNT